MKIPWVEEEAAENQIDEREEESSVQWRRRDETGGESKVGVTPETGRRFVEDMP
jgi:hypothetical protein